MTPPEENFSQHADEAVGCIDNALDELTGIRMYSLTVQEIAAVKVAQLALRDASPSFDNENLSSNRGLLEDYLE